MEMTEIVLLLIGIVLFVAGFLLPEKRGKRTIDTKQEEEQIHAFLDEELKSVKNQISGMAEETAQYAVEKTERSLERLTNEKMMAVNEYSDTVLKEIHRNHEEVMFLYDMLNDKHTNLKNTVKEVTKSAKEARETAQDAKIAVGEAEEKAKKVMETVAEAVVTTEEKTIAPLEVKKVETVGSEKKDTARKKEKAAARGLKAGTASKAQSAGNSVVKAQDTKVQPEKQAGNVDIRFTEEEDRANNNEKILTMHKAGKSNMAIAKELGLGIGEVKLVIDLFEGM